MKTLIVEDEMTSRIILQKILAAYGEVQLCGDGYEAIDAFVRAMEKSEPFDLICMDFMMPEMDGHTALSRIRSIEQERGIPRDRAIKVIMATGMSAIEEEYSDIAGLCDAIIQKPIRKDTLVDTLERMGLSR
ncbi:MAG TPA: response regulator [Deltaproteobacteria bacterium]|nr:response regulator [Deltaproteobacteria bacterium]HQI81745.1 response regulator [Deltaproteobacteria bacterium]